METQELLLVTRRTEPRRVPLGAFHVPKGSAVILLCYSSSGTF